MECCDFNNQILLVWPVLEQTDVLIDRCLIGCVQFYSNRESGLVSAVTQWFVVYSIKQDSLNQD